MTTGTAGPPTIMGGGALLEGSSYSEVFVHLCGQHSALDLAPLLSHGPDLAAKCTDQHELLCPARRRTARSCSLPL
jgi:hypothetical protein